MAVSTVLSLEIRAIARRASLNIIRSSQKHQLDESASALTTMVSGLVGAEYGLLWTPCRQVDTLADRAKGPFEGTLTVCGWHAMPIIRGSSSIS